MCSGGTATEIVHLGYIGKARRILLRNLEPRQQQNIFSTATLSPLDRTTVEPMSSDLFVLLTADELGAEEEVQQPRAACAGDYLL